MSSMPVPSSPMPVALGAAEGAEIVVPPPPLRVSVGGFAFAAAALFFLGLATFLWFDSPSSRNDGVPVWGTIGVACAIGAVVALVRRARLRFRARMFQAGFTIDDAEFRFDDVEAVALEEKPRLSNGKPIGFDRRLSVRSAARRADVRHFVGRIDVLRPFVDALLARATAAAERRLPRGVQGAGWRADAVGLRAGRSGVTRYDEVTKAGIFDGQVRLWRRNEEAPFLSMPLGSDNAFLLLRLLAPRMRPQQTPATPEPQVVRAPSAPGEPVRRPAPAAGDLGRLLFQRRGQRLLGFLTGIFALFTPAIPFLWTDAKSSEDQLVALFITFLGPFCLVVTLYLFTVVVRFHEHAVVKKSIFGGQTHRYAAVERMKWAETRMYVNGGYAGTSHVVKLHSTGQKRPLKFAFQRSGHDDDLAYVRDTIAYHVSQLMDRQLTAYGSVPWGGLVLTKDALEVHRGKNVERLPYATPLRVTMAKGVLQLFRPNEKKPAASITAGAENFFPGLAVWQSKANVVE